VNNHGGSPAEDRPSFAKAMEGGKGGENYNRFVGNEIVGRERLPRLTLVFSFELIEFLDKNYELRKEDFGLLFPSPFYE
jgi:hypothetical protein